MRDMRNDRVRVGDILRMERTPVQPDPFSSYTSIGVRSFGRGIFRYQPQLGSELGKLRFFVVEPNRLVISNIKGWEGAVAVTSPTDVGCIASNRFLMYEAVANDVDVRWARWYFLSEPGLELIRRASPGSADRNRTLAIERFEDLEIPLPPVSEQRTVAASLERIHAATTRLVELNRGAAQLGAAIDISLCTRPDMGETEKQLQGWGRIQLGEVLKEHRDEVVVQVSDFYDLAGVYSFAKGLLVRGRVSGIETRYKSLTRIHDGQLVMSRLKAWEGALAVVPSEFDGWFVSQEFPTFDLDVNRLDPAFFEGVIRSQGFWGRLKGVSHGMGARRERVSAERLLQQYIDLPPLAEQQRLGRVAKIARRLEIARRGVAERSAALLPAALHEVFA